MYSLLNINNKNEIRKIYIAIAASTLHRYFGLHYFYKFTNILKAIHSQENKIL
jgi:hypothetical protein